MITVTSDGHPYGAVRITAIVEPDTLTDGTPGFLARAPINPGCHGFGATPDEALSELAISRASFRRSGPDPNGTEPDGAVRGASPCPT